VVVSTLQVPTQRIAGHLCEPAHATIQKADGGFANFDILRATDLNGFPIRLTASTNASALTLSFSKIRFEAPGSSVFEPPNGFTRYSSPEAMVDELAARQQTLRHKHESYDLPQMPAYGRPR
jgi:hypothetical protein